MPSLESEKQQKRPRRAHNQPKDLDAAGASERSSTNIRSLRKKASATPNRFRGKSSEGGGETMPPIPSRTLHSYRDPRPAEERRSYPWTQRHQSDCDHCATPGRLDARRGADLNNPAARAHPTAASSLERSCRGKAATETRGRAPGASAGRLPPAGLGHPRSLPNPFRVTDPTLRYLAEDPTERNTTPPFRTGLVRFEVAKSAINTPRKI